MACSYSNIAKKTSHILYIIPELNIFLPLPPNQQINNGNKRKWKFYSDIKYHIFANATPQG